MRREEEENQKKRQISVFVVLLADLKSYFLCGRGWKRMIGGEKW